MRSLATWLLILSVSLSSSLIVASADNNVVERENSIFDLNPFAYAEHLSKKVGWFNAFENNEENAGVTLHTLKNMIGLSVVPSNAWERAISLGKTLQTNAQLVLDDIAKEYQITDKVEEFKSTMNVIIVKANDLSEDLSKAAETHGVTVEALSDELSALFTRVIDELQAEFPAPDEAPNHELRKEMVSRVLDRIEEEIIHIGLKYGASETNLRAHIDSIKSIEELIVLTGDLIEQHPMLLEALVATASTIMMLIPGGFVLRPIIMGLFGFGPYGPVAGSAATWCQRRFFGAVVTKGSRFSLLQRAGMKIIPAFWEKVVMGIGARIVSVGVKWSNKVLL